MGTYIGALRTVRPNGDLQRRCIDCQSVHTGKESRSGESRFLVDLPCYLLLLVRERLVEKNDTFASRYLVRLAWSFARLRVRDVPLFAALAHELRVSSFSKTAASLSSSIATQPASLVDFN